MRVYITGIQGQLGQALVRRWSPSAEVCGGDLPEVDITLAESLTQAIAEARPDLVVHCAAMTDVDGCARNPPAALQINGLGTQNVALACQQVGASMVHISTNEVFSGRWDAEQARPYHEFDATDPINPYGASKAAGEWYVRHLLGRFFIVRTSWLYGSQGRNFIHTIQAAADKHGALRVVTDEVANPTWVEDLASAVVRLAESGRHGVYHLVNEGYCSRYALARRILTLTGRDQVPVAPIVRSQWPRPSVPPAFAPLANHCAAALGIRLRPWEEALAAYLDTAGSSVPSDVAGPTG
jgi:dTDP-4-dehydrorhamnose reductase